MSRRDRSRSPRRSSGRWAATLADSFDDPKCSKDPNNRSPPLAFRTYQILPHTNSYFSKTVQVTRAATVCTSKRHRVQLHRMERTKHRKEVRKRETEFAPTARSRLPGVLPRLLIRELAFAPQRSSPRRLRSDDPCHRASTWRQTDAKKLVFQPVIPSRPDWTTGHRGPTMGTARRTSPSLPPFPWLPLSTIK